MINEKIDLKFTINEAIEFLLSEGWSTYGRDVYRKGLKLIQVGCESIDGGVILQSTDICVGGHGEIFKASSLLEFKGHLYDFQGRMATEAIATLENVSKSLNSAIMRDFGDFADWANHSGDGDCTKIPEIDDVVKGFDVPHSHLFEEVWSVRERLKSSLADLY